MFERLLDVSSRFVIDLISFLGYGGVVMAMAIESACIPLPSEVIMPFSGFLVAEGRFSLHGVSLAGAIGCLLGSYVAYWVGATGGRTVIERYGRYMLITKSELVAAERFFARWGAPAVFIGRLLPAIRTFIALPAGIARMRLWPFTVYTVVGSYIWCFALAFAGMKLGQNWSILQQIFHRFQLSIVLILLIAIAAFIILRLRSLKHES